MKTSNQIRNAFFKFFKEHGHTLVPSSSLVPNNDPTLLFTNAGMVQFKELFLGLETRDYTRAVSSQRCVRAGGKHNDLENVGYTARHHTFFEMMGNFSFGDYFKKEAIQFSWKFLTDVLGIPKEKLWISVFKDDKEAAQIWIDDIGVDPNRISYCGEEDNFWTMGDTGPCGPCSEVFYDHGPEIAGGPPGSPEQDGDRYIEIWNLVFTQYDRKANGELTTIPNPCVDTGMGIERLCAVLQGVHNNYDTDLFTGIIRFAAELCGEKDLTNKSLRVVADHIRSAAFLIVDDVMPSNEGRGYVLRRIIRRAIRHGNKLGMPQPFFYKLLTPLIDVMGDAYPELRAMQENIETILKREEELFMQTLAQGLKLLEKEIDELDGSVIPGDVVFRLYDTYGFPADLTGDIARERNLSLDEAGFQACMEGQREKSRAASQFGAEYEKQLQLTGELAEVVSEFIGYKKINDAQPDSTKVIGLLQEGKRVTELTAGAKAIVVLDKTPFYAESGGQVGDLGLLKNDKAQFEVTNTTKEGDVILHHGTVTDGLIKEGDVLDALVNVTHREAVALNHSATHLLHAVLRKQLGAHVTQKGSLVAADRLRFDFSHFEPVTVEKLQAIEDEVNAMIRMNDAVETNLMTPEAAIESGAMALFGEKYGDQVRVLTMGESVELCGGTHVVRTGDIGLFKIISETGVAAGVRRIEAMTGQAALAWMRGQVAQEIAAQHELHKKVRHVEKELDQAKSKLAHALGGNLADQAKEIKGVKLLVTTLENAETKAMRQTMDQLKSKLGSAAIVLATVNGESITLLAGVTKDLTQQIKAGELVNFVAGQVGGKGGGRPDMAQAGGTQPENLSVALASVPAWLEDKL